MPAATHTPLALVAELTHRCPLHCVYCSNPLDLARRDSELSTEDWTRVFREAGAMGVLQTDLTGGEPLARTDLAEVVRAARAAGLYASLITSGMPLDERRLEELVVAGLDHLQLSFQGAKENSSAEFGGARPGTYEQKLRVASWVKKHRIGFTLNFVIHRENLDQLEAMIALAEEIAPGRVEFAHVQYYGWALSNRARLLPSRAQLDTSLEILNRAQERLRGRIRLEYVVPDYYAKYPKPCMGGWGRKVILVTPAGDALPCHAARVISGLAFENVRTQSLLAIWEESEAFRKYRGEGWMLEPCRSCDRRAVDFGGCRCQAYLLANNAETADPVCSLSPERPLVDSIVAAANRPAADVSDAVTSAAAEEWAYRANPA
ncbi:MAG TPA: pyrroloquinoline quinone biosynthesis protein PqqE [Candidatus Acidoferrales bacterium]|nr:pyrroloquinoline quinone biosynthesis protein PqqE [Candidatus Acidoferrales bacterium]